MKYFPEIITFMFAIFVIFTIFHNQKLIKYEIKGKTVKETIIDNNLSSKRCNFLLEQMKEEENVYYVCKK